MIHIVIALLYLIGGVAAIIFGYSRWRKSQNKEELLWCAVGVLTLCVLLWNNAADHLLGDLLNSRSLFWSAQILDTVLLVAWISLAIRVHFFKDYGGR
jgi:drug/metabolite transporter superfamily protein YnfA